VNRITQQLAETKASGKKALVAYIVHGDPALELTLPAMHALVAGGADIIELGVPFSDPMAEGPVIQKGHERALLNGASLSSAFEMVAEFRKTNSETPVVLMGYANPIERAGYDSVTQNAVAAGVDGLLTVDLPPEEAQVLNEKMRAAELENIFLIAPTTTEDRVSEVTRLAGGFIYYVSLKGVTGAGHLDVNSVAAKVDQIRSHTDLPVLVGFGIKDRSSAKAIGACADGVVVGSVIVAAMAEFAGESSAGDTKKAICEKIISILKPIREGLDEL